MRVGIIRQKSEVLAEPMVNTRKQRVVGGIAFVRSCRNAREKRSIDGAYLGQRSSGLLVAGGRARTKDRRIGIIPKPQMVGSVAQVTRSHQPVGTELAGEDRKSTRLNSSHQIISYAVFCLKKKKNGN